MLKTVIGFFLVVMILGSAVFADEVNGELLQIENCTVLRVWGTHGEMGYAHGYLMATDIMSLARKYMFTLVTPDEYENTLLPIFRIWFTIPEPYQEEIDGMYQGMVDSGADLTIDELNRDITAEDIGAFNAVVDLIGLSKSGDTSPLACSSISGWGDGTLSDPVNPGGTIHCRDMDWSDSDDHVLAQTTTIIAYAPSDPGKNSWISVGFPGFIACLSGMNDSGVGATLNMGNYDVYPVITFNQIPICFQVRESLEQTDPNSDGFIDAGDVWSVLNSHSRIPSVIVHGFGPNLARLDPPCLVIEANYDGIALRLPGDDPILSPNFIAATNHHRTLYNPVSCWRYTLIQTLVTDDYVIDTGEAWEIESRVSVSTTLQTMLFQPDTGDVWLAVAASGTPAPEFAPERLKWDLFFPACIHSGDVSLDGSITAGDAQMAFQIVMGAISPTHTETCAADCDGNDEVTAGDAQMIFAAALGMGVCVDE